MAKIKLTAKNYHTDKNPYLSNSKISLFLKSKEAYKKHFIDRTDGFEMTPSLLIGRAVDLAFEKGKVSAIDKMFCRKVLKRDNALAYEAQQNGSDKRECLTDTQYENAVAMATKILGADFYKEYRKKINKIHRKTKFQAVLTDEEIGIAGMLDAMIIDESSKTIYIDDLKTSAPMAMKSKRSWFYHCLEYGYFRQFAIYRELVKKTYPEYDVICRHIVIGSGDYYPIKLFIIDPMLINRELPGIALTILQIKEEKEWVDYIPTWDSATIINNPDDSEN